VTLPIEVSVSAVVSASVARQFVFNKGVGECKMH